MWSSEGTHHTPSKSHGCHPHDYITTAVEECHVCEECSNLRCSFHQNFLELHQSLQLQCCHFRQSERCFSIHCPPVRETRRARVEWVVQLDVIPMSNSQTALTVHRVEEHRLNPTVRFNHTLRLRDEQ